MRIAVISFTKQGARLSGRIKTALEGQEHTEVLCHTKCSAFRKEAEQMTSLKGQMVFVEEPLADWTRAQFGTSDAIIFVGACGIAVRAIAPAVRDKLTDIPVLVLDELGQYVIPILSGHYGGGNELAVLLAEQLGAQAVLTTATDVNGLFAVDVFAKKNQLLIGERSGIAKVSAKLLQERQITMKSAVTIEGEPPGEVKLLNESGADVVISPMKPEHELLHLYPKCLVLGMGCRKGKSEKEIRQFVTEELEKRKLSIHAVAVLASINVKAEEAGLAGFAKDCQIPFVTYSKEQLLEVEGTFASSAFVKKTVGVDNVCERAVGMVLREKGHKNIRLDEKTLLAGKTARDGMTLAIGCLDWKVSF